MDVDSHVDEILNILKDKSDGKISKEEIKKEFEKFMEYGVPINQAKQTIVKKYGEEVVFTGNYSSERTLISKLKPNQSSVKVLGHVLTINPKEVTVKGENKKIFYGIIEDESGTVPFTSWTDIEVEKGDVVEISNAYTREWQGAVQLNIGDRVKVEKTEKEKLPKSAFQPKKHNVGDLKSGMGRVEVTAKIIEINEREVTVDDKSKKVFSGIIADETGKAQFTSWHDFKIKKDDVLNISGGYVKSWKGVPQLTFDENADVKKLDKNKISIKDIKTSVSSIFKVVEKRGGLDLEIRGTVIDLLPGSGFVLRCPECNRVLQNDECSIHGKVKGVSDLRLKLVVDDGTGSVGAIVNKELTEKMIGKKLDQVKNMDNNEFVKLFHEKLFAKKVIFNGNALSDQFGITFIPKDFEIVEVDVGKEAEEIIKELEDL